MLLGPSLPGWPYRTQDAWPRKTICDVRELPVEPKVRRCGTRHAVSGPSSDSPCCSPSGCSRGSSPSCSSAASSSFPCLRVLKESFSVQSIFFSQQVRFHCTLCDHVPPTWVLVIPVLKTLCCSATVPDILTRGTGLLSRKRGSGVLSSLLPRAPPVALFPCYAETHQL